MRLHTSLLEALADIHMHSSSSGSSGGSRSSRSLLLSRSSSDNDDSSTEFPARQEEAVSGLQHSSCDDADGRCVDITADDDSLRNEVLKDLQALRQQQQQQSIPPHAGLLDDIEAAATAGPVGGAKAAYVAAKLLAAAVWRHWGLEEDPLQGLGLQGVRVQPGKKRDGPCLSQVLLSSGGFLPAHHAVIHSLGGCAEVLTPVLADGHGVKADMIIGWCPNLYHDVYQDIDLV
jgi:hypothetical protein